MKRLLLTIVVNLVFVLPGAAQQSPTDTPATKEDVQRYLDAMHAREMMAQMVDAMIKPMHQMIHEQYIKDKDKLPADFETRMNKMMDDMMKSFPWDEMLQAEVPVYQKHFTKGDIEAFVVFYGSPTGQKMLREMPAIMGEAMQAMMPLLRKQMDAMQERVQQEVAEMVKDRENKPGLRPKSN
jgi:hypothetical protein